MLQRDELVSLLSGIDFIGRENALAFRILLVTCVRGVELVKAKKVDVDLDAGTWWVPDESVKTRSGFLVPLPPVVVDWFRELIALSGDSQWVVPARRIDRVRRLGDVPVGRTTLWAAFNRAFVRGDIDIRRFTPHDTRSTAKGHLRNLGVSREISEIALNHTLKGMEAIYDVREDIPERRHALAIWADFLVECETGKAPTPPKNVVPIRQAA
jgi:integrase